MTEHPITLDGSTLSTTTPSAAVARILVLDDQFAIRNLIDEILTVNGYEVRQASNLTEAEQLLTAETFDAIVVDIFLSERETGLSLLPRAREHQPNTPVIVISGMASMDNVMEALKAGAYDMITKPFNVMDMLNVIARAVEKKRMSDENERLVVALRRERDLLEDRVQEATRDLQATIETLRRLNVQVSTMFEIGQARLTDASAESIIHTIFNLLHRTLDFEDACCLIYDLKALGISLTHADGDEGQGLLSSLGELLRAEGPNLARLANQNAQLSIERVGELLREGAGEAWPDPQWMLMPLYVPQTLVGVLGLQRRSDSARLQPAEERMLSLAIGHLLAGLEQRNFITRTGQLAGLGELISEIAHDLRHPMTALRGASRMLIDGWQEEIKRTRCLDEIGANLGRMESLVAELVNFYNPREMNIVAVELHALLDKALSVSKSLIEQKGITVERCYADGDIMILGLTRNLIEAFINLIVNASQAMEAEVGRLTVSTCRDLNELEGEELRRVGLVANGYVRISIADNGCGIPDEHKDRVFRRFFTTKPEGHGLGLSAVMRICKKNLGHIRLESAIGQGTTFHLYLPKA